jgi:putative transposase
VKYAFIRQHASEYPVAMACRVLGVSRTGYHAWQARPESARRRADRALGALVAEAHAQSRRTYGAPRIHEELRSRGLRVGRKRVARLMRRAGLRGAVHPRRRTPAAPRAEAAPAVPNRLARRFRVSAPNRVWCCDAKQIWTREGWLHLAVVIDLYSRRVVGHACGRTPDTALAVRALGNAAARRRPPAGLLHHSDRGAAYRSQAYAETLVSLGGLASMSRPGTPLDNAVVESFFSTLERECLQGRRFATRAEAARVLFDYIEVFYNRQRRHSTLGYLSPAAFESQTLSQGVSTKAG